MTTQRELIASALRKLGPERCEQGLAAFDESSDALFDRCFLARAYGPPGALQAELPGDTKAYATALGITDHQLWTVVNAFDDIMAGACWGECGEVDRTALRQMVEAEASKARVVKQEPVNADA